MKLKKLKFSSTHPFLSVPKSAKSFIPDWYKKAEQPGNLVTFKKCIPFLDAMMSGYIMELSQDIFIEQTPNGPFITWKTTPTPVESRNKDASKGVPAPAGYDDTVNLAWASTYNFKTPIGYSVLVTHPFNRYDLPFVTLSGVVDADDVMHSGKIPFFIKENFEGIIPKGTPIAQLFPYKRESWGIEEDKTLNKLAEKSSWESSTVFSGWYKKNRWFKKEYN